MKIAAEESKEMMENNSVLCELRDSERVSLGTPMFLSQNVGPKELQQIVNKLLGNEEKLPYGFYISDHELVDELENFLQKNKVSVEKVVQIVYQPQAIFRVRPVSSCSATIAGHTEAVLTLAFRTDGKHSASGSGDTTVRMLELSTQTLQYTCRGHKNWVLCTSWSPDSVYLVTGSKSGEILCWDPQTGKPLRNPLVGHKSWINDVLETCPP